MKQVQIGTYDFRKGSYFNRRLDSRDIHLDTVFVEAGEYPVLVDIPQDSKETASIFIKLQGIVVYEVVIGGTPNVGKKVDIEFEVYWDDIKDSFLYEINSPYKLLPQYESAIITEYLNNRL